MMMEERMPWENPLGAGQCAAELHQPTEAEMLRRRAEQALFTLNAAREIRADAALMVEIRKVVREHRDQMGALLDELG